MFQKREVSSGSFVDGNNPLHEDLSLFLVQMLLIITLSRVLAYGLNFLRQPPVIAEVIGGLILGPTCLSSIPQFKNNVFPDESLPRLKLVSDFGLTLYLFLVGIELDPVKVVKDLKKSMSISLAGIVFPFSLGVGVSKLIYDLYGEKTVPFTSFFVFLGVAMSITAFPVLARILASRKLMSTKVGQITLAAAATDDAMAWILLVLVVALINNPTSSVNALYVFLIVVAYGLFLYFAIRPLLVKMVSRNSQEGGITQTSVTVIFGLLCASAWFTAGVGVHAIFGAFLVGLITPHDNGFAIKITEKIEDLVSILLLPLYFAYSGLKTQLGTLNDATSWGIVFLVIFIACGGKIVGCTVAARFSGIKARESLTIGVLMNTKGLVELIVLNLGLQGGIITQKVFSIFVLMALVTTFMTTPLVSIIYPFKLYIKSEQEKQDELEVMSMSLSEDFKERLKLLVCLPSMRSVPAMMNLTQLFTNGKHQVDLIALRLIELGNRMSKLMMAADSSETIHADAVTNVFRTFGQLSKQSVTTLLEISDQSKFATNINNSIVETHANLVIFPVDIGPSSYPVGWAANTANALFARAKCTVAVLGERGFGVSSASTIMDIHAPVPGQNQIIFFPFFGSRHDFEAVLILDSFSTSGITIEIMVMDAYNSCLDVFTDRPNVKIEEYSKVASPILRCLTKMKSLGTKDLIVLGYDVYMNFAEESISMKHYIDTESHSSFMVIHQSNSDDAKMV